MSEQPIQEKFYVQMRALAKYLDRYFNGDDSEDRKIGFALLCFDFDCPPGARTNYISNAQRPEMIQMLKEFIARAEGKIGDKENLQ